MEVDSAVRDHQQTNQQDSEEVEGQLSQCEAAAANNNNPEDTEPVNQTETGEEVNLKSAKPSPPDNPEDQAPVSQNGHGETLEESQGDNCANDCEEQIDVVNSDHDEMEVKSTENNAAAEENGATGLVEESCEEQEDSGPVEGDNEIQDQETTNENHQENQSQESDTPAEKESPNSEEELILEKVEDDSMVDGDNNEKSSAEHDEETEMVIGEEDSTETETDYHQVQAEQAMELADEAEEKEMNSEPQATSTENSEEDGNVTKEREEEGEEVTHEENSEHLTDTIENGENAVESITENGESFQDQESSEAAPVSIEDSQTEGETKENQEEKDGATAQDHESPEIVEGEEEKMMEVEDEPQDTGSGATEVEGNEICEEKAISAEAEENSDEREEKEEGAETGGNLVEMEDEILSLNSSQHETECANKDDISRQSSRAEESLYAEDREGDRDQLEENLECILPPKKERDVSEQVLVDDEDMVITQITSIDELEVSHQTNGHSQIVQKPKTEDNGHGEAANIDQFTEVEDLIIHALDTVSPFDAKFISDHMPGRDEQQIERRLTDHSFRKLSFSFQKLPFLMFEMIFVGENKERSSSLMLLTQKSLLQLKNKHGWCDTSYNLEVLELRYNSKTRFGIDVGALCEFIITNIPSIHMPYLRRNVREIEAFLEASNINYRKPNTKRDLKQLLNKVQQEVTMESLRLEGKQPIRIDEEGELHLTDDHEDMLRKIVANVGICHWEEVTKLLLAVYEYDVDIDLDDDEIYEKIKCYYESKLDPNLSSGFFTEDEDKCIIFMYKYWSKIMEDDQIWKQISQHLVGRSANQVKNRFLRTSQTPLDLTLENIVKYPEDKSNPATFNSDMAHIFSLTVVQKNLATDLEITSKLQHETRYLVLGTSKEMFILPCKDSAVRPHHPGVVQHTFTYDPSRPPQQFVTFVKLTFGNGLKKLGLLEDPERFNFNNIELHSPSIHQMMEEADRERSVI